MDPSRLPHIRSDLFLLPALATQASRHVPTLSLLLLPKLGLNDILYEFLLLQTFAGVCIFGWWEYSRRDLRNLLVLFPESTYGSAPPTPRGIVSRVAVFVCKSQCGVSELGRCW